MMSMGKLMKVLWSEWTSETSTYLLYT